MSESDWVDVDMGGGSESDWVDVEPRTWGDTFSNLGKSLTRGAQGVASIASLFGNPASQMAVGDQIAVALGLKDKVDPVTQALSPINQMDELRTAQVGNPDYSNASRAERYTGAAAEMLPSAVMGGGVVPALVSGVGGEVAKDLGAPEIVGQLLGGLAPMAGRIAAKPVINAASSLTKGGQERIAAQILDKAAGPSGAAWKQGKSGLFGPLTYAEEAQTPGAAILQSQIGKELDQAQVIKAALDDRAANRLATVRRLAPDSAEGITPDVRGANIRQAALPIEDAAKAAEEGAWGIVDKQGMTVPVGSLSGEMAALERELIGPKGLSADAQRILREVKNKTAAVGFSESAVPESRITIGDWQKIRSDAGEQLAKAANFGDKKEARLMAELRERLDKAAEDAASGSVTATREVLDLQSAIQTSKGVNSAFKSGAVGDMLQRGEGGFRLRESAIPQKLISTPESAKQYASTFAGDEYMIWQGRAALVDDMMKKGPDTWVKYFDEKAPQFQALFGKEMPEIDKVVKDLASEQTVGKLNQYATGKGSITSQALTGAAWVRSQMPVLTQLMGSKLGPVVGAAAGAAGSIPGAVVGGLTGLAASKAANAAEQGIKTALSRAIVDPDFRRLLAQKITPASRLKIVEYFLPSSSGKTALQTLAGATAQAVGQDNAAPSGSKSPESSQTQTRLPDKATERKGQEANSYSNRAPNSLFSQTESRLFGKNNRSVFGKGEKMSSKVNLDRLKPEVRSLLEKAEPEMQALVMQESSGNPNAVSKAGAKGLTQLMDATGREWHDILGLPGEYDPFNAEQNLKIGTAYYRWLKRQFGGDKELALTAYNQGIGNVQKALAKAQGTSLADIIDGLGPDGQKYASGVLGRIKGVA